MTNSADPDQLASSEANWSGSTLFTKTGHDVFSKRSVNKKGMRKVQGVPQSQTAALPKPQEEEETDKSSESILLPSDKSKKYWMTDEHYRHWSDATEHSIWSGYTLFAQICQSQYLG